MKVVKSRAFKDRLKGHKESVIALFSPYGEDGHMLYSISKDGSVRGSFFITQAGISPKDKSPSKPCLIRNSRERRRKKRKPSSKLKEKSKKKYVL